MRYHFIIVLSTVFSIANAGDVVLTMSNPADVKLSRWPVSIAVPFPVGELPDAKDLQVIGPGGKIVAAQFRILTRWWGRDGSVQTLLVTFIADASVKEYRLLYGKAAATPTQEEPVTVSEQNGAVTIASGPMKAIIDKSRIELFHGLLLNMKSESIMVEESGPVRAIVAVRGPHAETTEGKKLGCILRLHFFAGVPVIRIEYTFVQDTGKVFVDVPSASLDVSLPPGKRKIEFGVDTSNIKTLDLGSADRLALIQLGFERGEKIRGLDYEPFRKIVADRRKWWSKDEEGLWDRDERQKEFEAKWTMNGQEVAKSEKSPGWVRIAPEAQPWAVTAGIRWFWQLHPKGISVEGDRLRLFMVPEIPKPLHLHLGTAKTHTAFLAFHKPGDDQTSMAYRDAIEGPPMVFPAPEWMCASKVWGEMPPRQPGKFRYFEDRATDWITTTYTGNVERSQAYGMMDFGDHDYGSGQWNNMETAEDYGIFIEFVRTGDRRLFDYFERAIYHFRDIDVSHADLTEGQFDYGLWLMPGYMPERLAKECATNEQMRKDIFYYLGDQPPPKGGIRRHSFRHFGNAGFTPAQLDSPFPEKRGRIYGGTCTVGGHGWIIGVIAHYMLTGDPFSHDVAEMTGDLILRKLAANNWGRDNWKNIDVVHLYKMTGREDYRMQARQAVDFFHENRDKVVEKVDLQRAPKNRTLMSPWYTIGQFIRDYHDLTNDADVAKKFVDMVDIWIDAVEKSNVDSGCGKIFSYIRDFKDSRCHGDFADLAYAYTLTGKRNYIDRGLSSFKVYMHHAYHSTCLFEVPKVLDVLAKLGVDPLDPPCQPVISGGARTKGYVEEDEDKDFVIYVAQGAGYRVDAEPVDGFVRVQSPDGKIASERKITMGGLDYFELRIPRDGETGIYSIEAEAPKLQFWITCDLPITSHRPARPVAGKFGKAAELIDCARLSYPAGKVPFEQGTIEMMVQPLWPDPAERKEDIAYHYHQLFDSRDAQYDQGITVYLYDSGKKGAGKGLIAAWAEVDKSENISVPCDWKKGEWHRVAFTYQRTGEGTGRMALYIDGECVGKRENVGNFPTRPYRPEDQFLIGVNATGSANTSLTGLVDWIRISNVVRADFPDIQPTADEHTTFLATFDDGKIP